MARPAIARHSCTIMVFGPSLYLARAANNVSRSEGRFSGATWWRSYVTFSNNRIMYVSGEILERGWRPEWQDRRGDSYFGPERLSCEQLGSWWCTRVLKQDVAGCPGVRLRRRISDSQRCLSEYWPQAKGQFTECWNSWSHEFARSSEALSGARLNTSSADMSA